MRRRLVSAQAQPVKPGEGGTTLPGSLPSAAPVRSAAVKGNTTMRLIPWLLVLAVLSGCKADIDMEKARAYACTPGAEPVDSGTADEQCPEGSRCGLEGTCHDTMAKDYACAADGGTPSDAWCEAGWRCSPDGVCVPTDKDALLPRTGGDVSATLLFPLNPATDAGAFSTSATVLRETTCGPVLAKSASWVSGTTLHRLALVTPQKDDAGVLCDPADSALKAQIALPADFVANELLDMGHVTVALGTTQNSTQACASSWTLGAPIVDGGCVLTPNYDKVRSSSLVTVEMQVGGRRFVHPTGSRFLYFNDDWEIGAGSASLDQPVIVHEPQSATRPTLEPLVDLAIAVDRRSNDVPDYILAAGADGGIYFSTLPFDGGLALAAARNGDAGSVWQPLNFDFNGCLPDARNQPKGVQVRYSLPDDGSRTFYVAFSSTENGRAANVIHTFDLLRPAQTTASNNCIFYIGGNNPNPQLNERLAAVRDQRYYVCEGAELMDFVPELRADGNRGLRAWCRRNDETQYFEAFTGPNRRGEQADFSTQSGQYVLPKSPWFQRPLRFSRSNDTVWSQMDDEGHIWSSADDTRGGTPAAPVLSFFPERSIRAALYDTAKPMLIGGELALGPLVVSPTQGWIPTSAGGWKSFAFGRNGIIPEAPVRNEPGWAVTRVADPTINLPLLIFDFASLVGGELNEKTGVRVPARLGDDQLTRPPYTALKIEAGDGSDVLMLAVDDTLTTADVTALRDPEKGFVFSPSQVVDITPTEVRLTPASRGPITSIAPQKEAGVFASGYLLAGGRPFKYTAANPQLWRTTEVLTEVGQGVAVVSQQGRMRVIYSDGAVVGLPSRTRIAAPLPATAGTVITAMAACNDLVALTGTGLFFLGNEGWKKVQTDAVFDASRPPTLHEVGAALLLSDSKGNVFRVDGAGGCQ